MSTPPFGPQDGQQFPPQGAAPYPGQPGQAPATPAFQINTQAIAGELKKQSPYVLGLIGAGVLALLVSFLPAYYKVTVSIFGFNQSESVNAWNGFFSWVGVLLLLAGAALAADHALGLVGLLKGQTLGYGLLGAFGGGALLTLLALFVDPGVEGVSASDLEQYGITIGRGIGYWLILLLALAGTAAAFLVYTELGKAGAAAPAQVAPGFAPAGYGAPAPAGFGAPAPAQPWGAPPTGPAAPVAPAPAAPEAPQPPVAPEPEVPPTI
ncbi:MAG: hypothetical protein LBM94_01255 [Propionibacteriaceae bacterium]|jgi:hypothetical protein|nr:hypothetical protein [Propionibacteriaceae bacterium]